MSELQLEFSLMQLSQAVICRIIKLSIKEAATSKRVQYSLNDQTVEDLTHRQWCDYFALNLQTDAPPVLGKRLRGTLVDHTVEDILEECDDRCFCGRIE